MRKRTSCDNRLPVVRVHAKLLFYYYDMTLYNIGVQNCVQKLCTYSNTYVKRGAGRAFPKSFSKCFITNFVLAPPPPATNSSTSPSVAESRELSRILISTSATVTVRHTHQQHSSSMHGKVKKYMGRQICCLLCVMHRV